MNEELEKRLRQALRPVDPGEDFAAQVLARVARKRIARFIWLPAALAASLVLAVAVRYEWQQQQEAAGLEARRQVLEALRVTSDKLDLAYHMVNSPAPAHRNDNSGV